MEMTYRGYPDLLLENNEPDFKIKISRVRTAWFGTLDAICQVVLDVVIEGLKLLLCAVR